MLELSINARNVRTGAHSANMGRGKQRVLHAVAGRYANTARKDTLVKSVAAVRYASMESVSVCANYAKVVQYANTIKSGQPANSAEEVQYASIVGLEFLVPIATVDMLANQGMSHTTLVAEHTATNA